MEEEVLTDKLTMIFRTVFNDDSIVLSDKMTADDIGAWDSLSHMLLITEVENAFAIKFSLREINKLRNVGTLMKLIDAKRAN